VWIGINILTSEAFAQVKRNAPIVQETLVDGKYVTWSDINEMKLAMYGTASVFVVWALSQIWAAFWKKQDKTAETLEALVKAVDRIEAHLLHVPTNGEVQEKIRQEIKYAQELQE
jgi:acyl-homoserine lactone acylase PvdQ